MPDIWMDVDIAITVPVSAMPLVDRTDFITIEDAVVYNEAGMAIVWNFVTTLGVMTTTAFTPTSGAGLHDWIEEGTNVGMYSVEIPASTGTVNNDTEGVGWISGETTTTLPFRGPFIGFRAAAINDALIDGGDLLDVNVTEIVAGAVPTPAVTGIPDVNVTHIGDGAVPAPAVTGVPDVNVTHFVDGAAPAPAATGVPDVNTVRINDAALVGDGNGTPWDGA